MGLEGPKAILYDQSDNVLIGQQPMTGSLPVVFPSDQVIAVTTAVSNADTGVSFGWVLYGGPSGVLTPIRATTYTEQTANFTGSIISASASDAAAGVGARTVKITYYDVTGAGPFTETATLNGTTSVPLVSSNKCFIEKMEVLTNGSTGWNVGDLTLRNDAVATVGIIGRAHAITSPVNRGDNRTLWGHHYVPAGKTASLYTLTVGTNGNQIGVGALYVDYPLTATSTEIQLSEFRQCPNNGGDSFRQFANAIVVDGFARVTVNVISNGTNTNFFGAFDWSEV
jgi:hypothetical protein